MENAIEDVDGAAFALQACRWENNNCGPTVWLVMIEWVVRACGVEIDPKSLAGLAVADRGQQPGTVPSLVDFCGTCVFLLRLPQDKGKKNLFLSFIFHLHVEYCLGPRATKLPHFFLPKPVGNENFLGGPRKNM